MSKGKTRSGACAKLGEMSQPLPEGLHESLLTEILKVDVDSRSASTIIQAVDPAEQPHVLARHLYQAARRGLAATSDPEARLTLVNGGMTT